MTKLKDQIEEKIKQIEAALSSLSAQCGELDALLVKAEKEGVDQGWLSGIRARLADARKKKREKDKEKEKLTFLDQLKARRTRDNAPQNGDPPTRQGPKR